jgi:hypothetical protein
MTRPIGASARLDRLQLYPQSPREAYDDLVLHWQEIGPISIELIGPRCAPISASMSCTLNVEDVLAEASETLERLAR